MTPKEYLPADVVFGPEGLLVSLTETKRILLELQVACIVESAGEVQARLAKLMELIVACQTQVGMQPDTQSNGPATEATTRYTISVDDLTATLGESNNAELIINALASNDLYTAELLLKPEIITACRNSETFAQFCHAIRPNYNALRLTDKTYGLLRAAVMELTRHTQRQSHSSIAAIDGAYI